MRVILDPRLNRPWRYTLIYGLLALLLPFAIALITTDQTRLGLLNDISLLAYLLVATGMFLWAAHRTGQINRRLGRSWWILALSQFWFVIAQVLWISAELSSQQIPDLSTGAIFYLLFFPSFWLGVYLMPQARQTKFQRIRQLLDSVTVLVGVALALWLVWIAPLRREMLVDSEIVLLELIAFICSFTLIAALVVLIFRPKLDQPREPLILLGIGCLLLLATDFLFTTQIIESRSDLAFLVNYLSGLICILGTMAAVLQATAVKIEVKKEPFFPHAWRVSTRLRATLPPLILTIVYALTIYYHDQSQHNDFWLISIGVWTLFALVSLRQLFMMGENISLSAALHSELVERKQAQLALQKSNEVLEQRVSERTHELVSLNQQLSQNEHKLRFDAFHDKLTGLSNRAFFTEQLQQAIERSRSHADYQFGILFLDFDGFKVINDSLGHWLGDEFLVTLSLRLEQCIAGGDLVARLGGDEFVILLNNLVDVQVAQAIADEIQQAMRAPFDVDGHRIFTSVSIGIVIGDGTYFSAEDILRDADIAMYQAKEQGKARSIVFNSAMRVVVMERLKLETELRDALIKHEFFLTYQPIWDLTRAAIAGFEALVRWRHPTRGIISPLQFIPIAEETGMIVPLGEWVLGEACRQMKEWHAKFPVEIPLTISVNISAHQFRQSDLVAVVEKTLCRVGFPAAFLKLEITESAFMYDIDAAIDSFTRLNALGLQLQLDDFGTGYSSLGYLQRLPITTLKIDRTFISRINLDGQNIEIARAIASLAHNLHMNTIAEGIETEAQLAHVQSLDCEQVQGYLISVPLEVEEAERFIEAKLSNYIFTNSSSSAS